MPNLTIRNLDERVRARLRVCAAHHGLSMEQEARAILEDTLLAEEPRAENLAQAIRSI